MAVLLGSISESDDYEKQRKKHYEDTLKMLEPKIKKKGMKFPYVYVFETFYYKDFKAHHVGWIILGRKTPMDYIDVENLRKKQWDKNKVLIEQFY